MPMNGISSGKDLLFTIIDSQQGVIGTSLAKEVTFSQKINARETQGLDGVIQHANFPAGWQGTIMMDRTNNAVDNYIANYEQLYFNGQTLPSVTIQFQITEANGGISTYLHENAVFNFSDAGTWKSDDFVSIKLEWKASNRRQL